MSLQRKRKTRDKTTSRLISHAEWSVGICERASMLFLITTKIILFSSFNPSMNVVDEDYSLSMQIAGSAKKVTEEMSVSDVHRVFLEMDLKWKANKSGKNPITKYILRNVIGSKVCFIAYFTITKNKSIYFSQSPQNRISSLYTAHDLLFVEVYFCFAFCFFFTSVHSNFGFYKECW